MQMSYDTLAAKELSSPQKRWKAQDHMEVAKTLIRSQFKVNVSLGTSKKAELVLLIRYWLRCQGGRQHFY